MAGVHLVLGVARLGFLVNFLSHSVLVGFTAAAALIIGLSQVKHLFGVSIERSSHVYETVGDLARAVGDTNVTTLLLGSGGRRRPPGHEAVGRRGSPGRSWS